MFQYNPTLLNYYIVENYTFARSDMNSVDFAQKKFKRGKFCLSSLQKCAQAWNMSMDPIPSLEIPLDLGFHFT